MPDDGAELRNLPTLILAKALEQPRSNELLTKASYYRCTQHEAKKYTFDGCMISFGNDLDVMSDDYIPMRRRRPSLRLDLPLIIVKRLTAFTFGRGLFPTIKVDGDDDAEDYVNAMCKEASLPTKMIEARNLGGACGSVALSWGFTEGKPVVEVHLAAFIQVLAWQSYHERRPSAVLKCYPYHLQEFDKDGNPVKVQYWYARYWDEQVDVTWPKIPREAANSIFWPNAEHNIVEHGTGICPVYWIQNQADSSSVDGISDFDGQEECFDTGDILYSATAHGTIQNVDPTLIVKDDKRKNSGLIRKGSQWAIYSKGGAEYLELSGKSLESGLAMTKDLRRQAFEKAGVVVVDPEKLSALGMSGSAIRLLYMPMLSTCDTLREQYGGKALEAMLSDMLTVARTLSQEPKMGDDGQQYWARVKLPQRVTKEKNDAGDSIVTRTERTPGMSSQVSLSWPDYFQPTPQDRKDAIQAMKEGTGGQQVVSQETAVKELAPLIGVEDVQAEIDRIEEDKEKGAQRAKDIMGAGAPRLPLHGDDDEEDQGGEEDGQDDGDGSS